MRLLTAYKAEKEFNMSKTATTKTITKTENGTVTKLENENGVFAVYVPDEKTTKKTKKEKQTMTNEAIDIIRHAETSSEIYSDNGVNAVKVLDSNAKTLVVKADSIFNDKEILPLMSYADDYKGTEIGNLIDKYNAFGLSAKVSLLEQGGILKQISDKKLYKGMSKTFDDFLKAQGVPKASAYRYIGGYKLCCDAFGKVKPEVLKLGSAVVNKAQKIGFTREGFQEVIDKAKADGAEVTPKNIRELADKYGISYDKEKADKELPKVKKNESVVEVKPNVKNGDIRFIGGKNGDLWFDIPLAKAVNVGVETAESALSALANNYGEASTKDVSAVAYLLPRNVVMVVTITKLSTVTTYTHKLTKEDLEAIAKAKAKTVEAKAKAEAKAKVETAKAKAEAKEAKAEAKEAKTK